MVVAMSSKCGLLSGLCRRALLTRSYGESGSGKSELLVHAAVSWALPTECGGCASGAAYLDTDFRLCLRRLRHLVEARVRASLATEVELARARDQTLARIAVVRCSTTLELLAALELVHNGDGPRPSLVALDSIGAFVWREDRVPEGPPSLS